MIFLSYNHKDGEILDEIASKFANVFGQDKVFYDKWSILPGDGIIDKMNEGLNETEIFFFFMSKNSLSSEMVKLEWQNALIKKANKKIRFIPVKLDDCNVPVILLQNLYINLYGIGLDVALNQMIDVTKGLTPSIDMRGYQNIRCNANISSDYKRIELNIYVETYFEPSANFLVLIDNEKDDVKMKPLSESMTLRNFYEKLKLSSGITVNAFFIGLNRGLSKGFPLRIELTSDNVIKFKGCMKAIDEKKFAVIPVFIN